MEQVSQNLWRGGSFKEAKSCYWLLANEYKIASVLNLERGYFEFFHGKMNADFIGAVENGLIHCHLQLGDLLPPSVDELRAAVHLVQHLLTIGPTYIHCLHGVDRTGMVVAAYRIAVEGRSFEEARDEMFSKGFHRFPYENLGWVDRLQEFSRSL